MSNRSKAGRRRKVAARGTLWLWVASLAFAAVIILGFRLMSPRAPELDPELGAVLIDQLSPTYPNDEFRSIVAAGVEEFGLPLDILDGEAVDVDLYRSLGLRDCAIIVIRSHSGILQLEDGGAEQVTALFTNEPYSELRHVSEQLRDQVLIVRPFEDDTNLTFGITPEFVLHGMRGNLPRSVVVIAGCSVLGRTDLAEALVARGASVVVSFDRSVGLAHADASTARCIEHLLNEEMTMERAIIATSAEVGPDPEFGALLSYYPPSAGDRTVAELLAGTG